MKILLTNDDGIHAPGLEVLEAIARQFSDDIWICAPDEEQSGMGHALTLTRPVRLRKHGERRQTYLQQISIGGCFTDWEEYLYPGDEFRLERRAPLEVKGKGSMDMFFVR